jgi:hypothetical protein
MNLLLLLGTGFAQAQDAEPILRTLPANVPRLQLETGRSSVTVRNVPGAESSQVTITPERWHEGCEVSFSGDADLAVAKIVEDGEIASRRCSAAIDIEIAGDTTVEVTMRQGLINAKALRSPLTVSLKRGAVFGVAAQADVAIQHMGLVRLRGLSAPSSATVGVGRIELAYAQEVAGDILAETKVGRIRVQLPYGTLIDDASTPMLGRTHSAVPHVNGHPTRLTAKTVVGSVQIQTDLTALTASLQAQPPATADGGQEDEAGSSGM